MNLFLDAFDRVFNPHTSSSSKRRASSSGLVSSLGPASSYSSSSRRTTNTTMTTTTSTTTALLNSPQKNNFRRQSGGAVNAGFQNEFVALTIGEPEEPSTSTRIQRQQSASSASRSRNRSSGRRKHLPPRQWSVPEREGNNDYNREPQTIERTIDVAEPFRLIQKAYSLSCEDPLSSSRSSLLGSPHSPLSISSHNCFNSGSTILFGFVTCQSTSASSPMNASLYSFWEKFALEGDRALNSEIYFLRCIDTEPKLPFIYYANFSPLSDHEQHINNLGELVDFEDISAKIQLGCYEQLYTLERAASPSPVIKNSLKHQGFIFIFFRLLGENCASSNADLESRWLDWTGAGQIYKYSPRCWDLQKVCLLKSIGHSTTTSTPFVYILLCEFNSILHPSNTIAALDFCQRLRSRNCGFVALYKVSQSHCPSQKHQKQYPYQQQKSFDYQPQKETNLSPNWPLQQQYRRQQLGRMGRSHDERVSIGARKESQQQHSPPSPRPISQRESEKGHSQQSLNDRGGTERLRRLIWAREQQHSLGWDQQQPQQWFGQTTNGTLL